MESSIRDIFFFWKLSWGLENDNTLFKNDNICYIPQTWKTILVVHSSKIDHLELHTKYWPWPIYVCWLYVCNILISSDNFMLHFFAPRFPSGWPPTTSVARESAEQISPGFDGTLWGWERPKTQGLGLGLVNGCVPKWAQKHPVGFFQNHFRGNQNGYMIRYIHIYNIYIWYIWLSLAIWILRNTQLCPIDFWRSTPTW